MAITCAIVNKNSTARRSLQQLCDQNEAISVVATCEDATDLLQCLRQKSVDLLLLDIEQRSLTDHLAELPTLPHIRLTTTRTEYVTSASAAGPSSTWPVRMSYRAPCHGHSSTQGATRSPPDSAKSLWEQRSSNA